MKALRIILSIFILALIFGGCTYKFIVEEPVIDPEDPDAPEVSFATTIIPVFAAKCTRCHFTGNQIPDLTADNAYSSINTSRYINGSDSESSLIYTKPLSGSGHSATYSDAEAANLLIWIKQGAQDN